MSNLNETADTNQLSELVAGSDPRGRSTIGSLIRGWWITSRMEYLPDAVVHVALPLLLVLRHDHWNAQLLSLSISGLLIWLMGHWVGSSLNCLADYPVDRLDTGHKSRLAVAIDEAGVRSILILNLLEAMFATVFSIWLAVDHHKPLLIVFWLIGLLIACLYSFEPIRFKRRNLLNPLALMMIVYTMPLLFVYHILSPVWDKYDLIVLIVYSFQMIPMFLVDEVSDYDEDKEMKVNNPCVKFGRVAVCWLAIAIYVTSCLASLVMFARESSSWSALRAVVMIVTTLIYLWVVREFFLLSQASRAIDGAENEQARAQFTHELKVFSKTPAWLVATGVSVLLLAATLAYLG